MQRVVIDVDNPSDILSGYGVAAKWRLERATTASMSGASEITTGTITTGTSRYTYWDTSAVPGTAYYYRTRYSKSSPSVAADYSAYSAVFQAGASTAYGTLDDLLERLTLPDTSRYNQLDDLLEASSRYLDSRIGFDFLRHPAVSGTETRTYDVTRPTNRLAIKGGIVSATTVSVASITGETLTALGAEGTDWYLHPRNLEPEGTYTHLTLLRSGSWSTFLSGQGIVSIAGAFGWPSVPTIVKEAALAHAARSYHEWQTKQAGPVGNPDFGGVVQLTPNLPDIVYRAIETYRRYWWSGI